MKIPIVKYSDRFLNSISWFMSIGGITLWPFIILREIHNSSPFWRNRASRIINHESIHIKQQAEMLVIFFYLWYFVEWFIKIFIYRSTRKAYYAISFEREAHENDDNLDYLQSRKRFYWITRIIK
jgi:hypothetical protein